MREVFVIGSGMIPFGRFPQLMLEDFAGKAVSEALSDSGVDRKQIGMAVFSTSNGGRVAGQRVLRELSLTGMPIVNVENACAGGGTSLHVGWMAVASGLHDVVLVVGMEKMEKGLIPPNPGEYESFLGKTLPAKYALRASKHMQRYGLTKEQLAMVSVKSSQLNLALIRLQLSIILLELRFSSFLLSRANLNVFLPLANTGSIVISTGFVLDGIVSVSVE